MSPKTLAREIEVCMVLIGSQETFFRFKTLTPIFPTMVEKLSNPSHYDDGNWNFTSSLKQNSAEVKELKKTLKIFKLNQDCSKQVIIEKHSNLPNEFGIIYDYLQDLMYRNKNYDPNLEVNGRLWLRELYIQAQNTIP